MALWTLGGDITNMTPEQEKEFRQVLKSNIDYVIQQKDRKEVATDGDLINWIISRIKKYE